MNQANCLVIKPILPDQAGDLSDLCLRIYPQYFTYFWDGGGSRYVDATSYDDPATSKQRVGVTS